MKNYLTLKEAAEYLNVTEDTIMRYVNAGELPFYKLERALRFKAEDIDMLVNKRFEILLTPGLRAAIDHLCFTKANINSWRVLVVFYNTRGKSRQLNPFGPQLNKREYKIFVTGEYLTNVEHLPANIYGAEKFALRYIKKRFEETRDKEGTRSIDRILEDVIYCSNGKCTTEPDPQFFN